MRWEGICLRSLCTHRSHGWSRNASLTFWHLMVFLSFLAVRSCSVALWQRGWHGEGIRNPGCSLGSGIRSAGTSCFFCSGRGTLEENETEASEQEQTLEGKASLLPVQVGRRAAGTQMGIAHLLVTSIWKAADSHTRKAKVKSL